jgi:hypothetical protein
MIEKGCRHRIGNDLLGRSGLGWNPYASQRRERTEIPQSKVSR